MGTPSSLKGPLRKAFLKGAGPGDGAGPREVAGPLAPSGFQVRGTGRPEQGPQQRSERREVEIRPEITFTIRLSTCAVH